MNPCSYGYGYSYSYSYSCSILFLRKVSKTHMTKRTSPTNVDRKKQISTFKRVKSKLSFFIKIYSKWLKTLNRRPGSLKLLRGNVGKTLQGISPGKVFVKKTPAAQEIMERTDSQDYIKLQSTTEETISRVKKQLTEQGTAFSSYSSDPGLFSRIHTELKRLISPNKSNYELGKFYQSICVFLNV